MWIGIVLTAYIIGIFLLMRLSQSVHYWDEEIDAMQNHSVRVRKRRPAA